MDDTAPQPTYHIDIWADPPAYVCQLCVPATTFRGTVPEVTQHLQDVHQADAIPTAHIEALLTLRREADARRAGASPAEAAEIARTKPPSPTEEPPHG